MGPAGERVGGSYGFYAVFRVDIECTVRGESQEPGTIVRPPPVGEKSPLRAAPRRCVEVGHRRHEVICTLVRGHTPACFGDVAGDIHARILEWRRGVLAENVAYPYLKRAYRRSR